jgi:hypothetical protein
MDRIILQVRLQFGQADIHEAEFDRIGFNAANQQVQAPPSGFEGLNRGMMQNGIQATGNFEFSGGERARQPDCRPRRNMRSDDLPDKLPRW